MMQVAGAYGEPDHELVVRGAAPEAELLCRKIDRQRPGDLVLHALEKGDLAVYPGGLFVHRVHVRCEVAKGAGSFQP